MTQDGRGRGYGRRFEISEKINRKVSVPRIGLQLNNERSREICCTKAERTAMAFVLIGQLMPESKAPRYFIRRTLASVVNSKIYT